MNKVKKGLCALTMAICGGTAFTVPMFAGCSDPSKEKESEISGYELVSVDRGLASDFYQNDVFTLNGRTITIKDKQTNEQYVITLNDDMLVGAPDMTTGGEKEIDVIYDGTTYSFVINVKEKTANNIQEQYKAILDKLTSDNIKAVDAQFSLSYDVRFLNQETSNAGSSPVVTITKEDIAQYCNTSDFMQNLFVEVFEALTNSLVKSGLDAEGNNVIDASNNIVDVSWEKFAQNFLMESLKKRDMMDVGYAMLSAFDAVSFLITEAPKEFLLNSFLATDDILATLTYQYIDGEFDAKVAYDNLKEYLQVLSSGDTQELAEFVAKVADNPIFVENLEQYGTPYFCYEQRKQIMNDVLEQVGQYDESLANFYKSYCDVLLELYKNVDEFVIMDANDFGQHVLNSFKKCVKDLSSIQVSEEYYPYVKYDIMATSEFLNIVLNEEYSSFYEALSLMLNEDALGDLIYEVFAEIYASYLNAIIGASIIGSSDIKTASYDTFNSIKNKQSLEDFNFFENLANILCEQQPIGSEYEEIFIEYCRSIDVMFQTGDFSEFLAVRAQLYRDFEELETDGTLKEVWNIESVIYEMANILSKGEFSNSSEFMLAVLNNEIIGEDVINYFTLGVVYLFGHTDFAVVGEDFVKPMIQKVIEDNSFENFDLMQRLCEFYEIEDEDSIEFFTAIDNFIAGKIDFKDFVIDFAKLIQKVSAEAVYFLPDSFNSMCAHIFTTCLINADKFLSDQTLEGLANALNGACADFANTYLLGDAAADLQQEFEQEFVTPFVEMLTKDGEICGSQFDLKQTVNLFFDFVENSSGSLAPEFFKDTILTIADVNNENYIQNLFSFENISRMIAMCGGSFNKVDAMNNLAFEIYLNASNGVLEQEEFVAKCSKLLTEIYDGINNDTIDYEETFKNVLDFAGKYLTEQTNTTIASVAAIYMIATNPDVDYNEIFSFIELPQGVSIDYNKLVQKIQTFENMVTISNIETQMITTQDNLIKEVVYITLQLDVDVEVAAINGQFVIALGLQN